MAVSLDLNQQLPDRAQMVWGNSADAFTHAQFASHGVVPRPHPHRSETPGWDLGMLLADVRGGSAFMTTPPYAGVPRPSPSPNQRGRPGNKATQL